jgi:hypothetical protein
MAEDQSLPDWLADIEEQPPEGGSPEETPRSVVERWVEDLGDEAAQPDVVEDLREYIVPEEELYETESSRAGVFPGMKPWQGLVLAVLLFLDVLVCGCMALLMLGRIRLPF